MVAVTTDRTKAEEVLIIISIIVEKEGNIEMDKIEDLNRNSSLQGCI